MNKDLFPKLYDCSWDKENKFWNDTTDITHLPHQVIWFDWFENELVEAKGNVDIMRQNTTAFIEDVIALKEQFQEKTEVLDFMQFFAATVLLYFLTGNKLFPYSFDWIINAIDGKVSTEKQRDFSLERIDGFIQSRDPLIQLYFEHAYSKWVHDLFYYSRSTGGHKAAGDEFVNYYLSHFCRMIAENPQETGVIALAQALSWCHQLSYPAQEKIIAQYLFEIYQQTNDTDLKKLIAFQFCVADSNYTELSKNDWCKIVQHEHSHGLREHEPVQLLANLYGHDEGQLLKHFEELIDAVTLYRVQSPRSSYPLLDNYQLSRIYSILERSIGTLLLNGHVEQTNRLIGAFFNIPDSQLIEPDNFYIIPNSRDGVAFCFESFVLHVYSDTIKNLPAITDLGNKFLGITHTFNDNKDFAVEAPLREGVPDGSYADAFCNAIRTHFNFKILFQKPGIEKSKGYHLFYGGQLPLQNIMATEIGFTIPLVHSFRKALPSRNIQEIFIWQGDTLLSEYERIGLQEIFASVGIKSHFSAHFESSKEEFIQAYTNPIYDVIWVICHGQYFHYEPHQSYLDLGSGITMKIIDLAELSLSHTDRRLVMVDACDGGTSALTNSPLSIGIGSAITDPSQSLLSHGWPVDNYSSLVIGLLLAIFLSEGCSYKEAHYKAISIVKSGKEQIIEMLKVYCKNEELIERIQYKELDYRNFMYWGSLIYME